MRALPSIGWLAIAAALHGVLLALAPSLRAQRRAVATPLTIALVTRPAPRVPEPLPPTPPLLPSPRAATVLTRTHHPAAMPEPPPPEPRPPPQESPGTDRGTAGSATAPAAKSPSSVELFSPSALGTVVGPPPPPRWGGHTRRAGDPAPPAVDDGPIVNERVQGWIADDMAEYRVRSGDVAPHWRDIERGIEARFHPSLEDTTSHSGLAIAGRQLWRGLTSAPAPATGPELPPGRALGRWEDQRAQSQAAAARFEQAADWTRVVIDVEMDAEGRVIAVRVVGSSGRPKLDAAALEAVQRAADGRGRPDRRRGATVARFYVDASPKVDLVEVSPVVDPTSGQVTGAMIVPMQFRFDEVRRTLEMHYPGKRDVKTRITLNGVRPAPAPHARPATAPPPAEAPGTK